MFCTLARSRFRAVGSCGAKPGSSFTAVLARLGVVVVGCFTWRRPSFGQQGGNGPLPFSPSRR